MTYEYALTALGDPTRRLVFERLRNGPSSVTALAEGLPVSRPAVSQHLKILKKAGLVADQVQGARRLYSAERGGLAALKDWLDSFQDDLNAAHQVEIQRQIDERKCT